MRLSEAIRLGAAMKPQAFNYFYNDEGTATCALGAAFDAINGDPEGDEWPEEWVDLYAIIEEVPCPECGESKQERRRKDHEAIIPHLNDDHRWTRERIADFVELHEPLPVPVEEAEAVHHG